MKVLNNILTEIKVQPPSGAIIRFNKSIIPHYNAIGYLIKEEVMNPFDRAYKYSNQVSMFIDHFDYRPTNLKPNDRFYAIVIAIAEGLFKDSEITTLPRYKVETVYSSTEPTVVFKDMNDNIINNGHLITTVFMGAGYIDPFIFNSTRYNIDNIVDIVDNTDGI